MKILNLYFLIVFGGILLRDVNWIGIREGVKDLVIIFGVIIALVNYLSQDSQRKIDNSLKILETFWNNISAEDLETWKDICIRNWEASGAELGFFIVYNQKNESQQIPLSYLFIIEGYDPIIDDKYKGEDWKLGVVKHMAEQFNIIGYQILNGKVYFNVIYFQLDQLMDTIYNWILMIDNEEHKRFVTKTWFSYFIEMYQIKSKAIEKLPKKTYINGC